ncbi:metallophosphoesterase family protein [Neptuniibacter sp. QD37_6]|uniref:metallophosphoesterase family protein n=1 Tax=Neptuniibacter sp. QD37_6 TaxID=3398210 RepID=UPI0039F54C7E
MSLGNMDLGTLTGPLLIFGGPYSNLAATRALKQEVDRLGFSSQQVICTGDLVAYCAEPVETLALIRDWGIPVVMGNCEESLAADAPDCGCGFSEDSACSLLSVEWYRFASQQVSQDDKLWMGQLPRQISFELAGKRFQVVHGSVDRINEFIFASSSAEHKQAQLDLAGTDVVIGGHCGIPFGTQLGQGYWLNSGVIGMPANDGTASVWYMLLTPNAQGIEVSWQRLDYPADQASENMQQVNLAAPYAECLRTGLWPSEDILPESERAMRGQTLEPSPILIT